MHWTFYSVIFFTEIRFLLVKAVRTGLPRVREKQNFLQVREMSGNFEKMSGNHLTHVREFCNDIVFRLKLSSYDKGSTWVVFIQMSAWEI